MASGNNVFCFWELDRRCKVVGMESIQRMLSIMRRRFQVTKSHVQQGAVWREKLLFVRCTRRKSFLQYSELFRYEKHT